MWVEHLMSYKILLSFTEVNIHYTCWKTLIIFESIEWLNAVLGLDS